MKQLYLKLRSNITLDGDIRLAEKEIQYFFSHSDPVSDPYAVEQAIGLLPSIAALNTRKSGYIGFIVNSPKEDFFELINKLNFIQEVWGKCSDFSEVAKTEHDWIYKKTIDQHDLFCALPLMACGELLSQSKILTPTAADIANFVASITGDIHLTSKKIKSPSFGGTSTQHVHSLHKYKAKFFPRLIRSFLVQQLDRLPCTENGQIRLLDPFVGSGTALIESSLLGIESVGVDIDKLSCAISEAKIDALSISTEKLETSVQLVLKAFLNPSSQNKNYNFPTRIKQKFKRWGTENEQKVYEANISCWLNAIDVVDDEQVKKLLLICLSDALTRKFVIRMMGTGVGRFALEIAKTSLDTLMASNFKAMIHSSYVANTVIKSYDINLAKAEVISGSAVSLPLENNSFSIIITSPPYLPASSGREDYLVGKAISNIALDLMTDKEIEDAEKRAVGSMNSEDEINSQLPQAVYELYNWLENDPLRKIKAKPTLAYYNSLKQALLENMRVLMPNGLAVYVIGKESVFYRFSDREVLYKVECDKIFEELAISCGFVIDERVDVELDKKNKNARPRSLDSYYETVFILRKPN